MSEQSGSASDSGEARGGITALPQYFRDSVAEFKKVSSPTRQETIQATMVVMFMIVVIGLYLGLLDLVFHRVMQALVS